MIEFQKTLFLQLQKTGGTFIEKFIKEHCEHIQHPKHSIPNSRILSRNDRVVMNIRSPFDWYLSLWSYGLMNQGGFRSKLCDPKRVKFASIEKGGFLEAYRSIMFQMKRKPSNWQAIYRLGDTPEAFQTWLKYFFEQAALNALPDCYQAPREYRVGFYTWRFLRLSMAGNLRLFLKSIKDGKSLEESFRKYTVSTHFLRTENLDGEFKEFLDSHHGSLSNSFETFASERRVNQSYRAFSREDYYDNKSYNLVSRWDELFFRIFKYR